MTKAEKGRCPVGVGVRAVRTSDVVALLEAAKRNMLEKPIEQDIIFGVGVESKRLRGIDILGHLYIATRMFDRELASASSDSDRAVRAAAMNALGETYGWDDSVVYEEHGTRLPGYEKLFDDAIVYAKTMTPRVLRESEVEAWALRRHYAFLKEKVGDVDEVELREWWMAQ